MRGQQQRLIKLNEKIELSHREENQLIEMIDPSFKKKAYNTGISNETSCNVSVALSPKHLVGRSPYDDKFSIISSVG